MHPAPSVIAFTTLSGLGFGLLAFLGLGLPPVTGWVSFVFFFLAYALAVGGLLASVAHLANPKNAIKAFSQWRSSWLSREGIAAVAALLCLRSEELVDKVRCPGRRRSCAHRQREPLLPATIHGCVCLPGLWEAL